MNQHQQSLIHSITLSSFSDGVSSSHTIFFFTTELGLVYSVRFFILLSIPLYIHVKPHCKYHDTSCRCGVRSKTHAF